jgi:hypothetical protein
MRINRQTYEEYFLLYTDGELTTEERLEVERFAEEHSDLKKELEMMKLSVLVADENVVFENKEILYREEKRRIIFLTALGHAISIRGKQIAVAALLLIFSGAGWWYASRRSPLIRQPEAAIVKPGAQPADQHGNITRTPPANAHQSLVKTAPAMNLNKKILKIHSRIRSEEFKHALVEKQGIADNDLLTEYSAITPGIAATDNTTEQINIPVRARSLAEPVQSRNNNNIQPDNHNNIRYANEITSTESNRIYFANTSFSKKNNMRVVFRKASRIFDRITTLQ